MEMINSRCDAVLVFDKRRLFDADVMLRLVEKSLRQKDHEIVASDEECHGEITMQTADMLISVKTDAAEDELMGRMMIAISNISEDVHADAPLVLLADICRKALLATEASQIVWLRKDVVFSAQQFLSAFAPVKPRRVNRPRKATAHRPAPRRVASGRAHQHNGQRLPHIDSMEEQIDQRFREFQTHDQNWGASLTQEEEAALAEAIYIDEDGRHEEVEELSRQTRISTWIMTAMLGLFSWPVASFFIIYNFFRGEDFRLSAHALGLAGAFSLLTANGATAATIQLLLS
ncbi:MAG: hypothetical protein QGI08_07060 [Paracoccaceae bacterium]|jgi:hypothetical protein|nr:hypothetical protein [Paracoccaceae bacterium]MDP7185462.1 hypothetical protein [Paracoccaceae bacterium]